MALPFQPCPLDWLMSAGASSPTRGPLLPGPLSPPNGSSQLSHRLSCSSSHLRGLLSLLTWTDEFRKTY